MTDPIGVLFVCTGNICRSPTAEAVFRHQAAEAGLDKLLFIDSAGTHGYHAGDPPDIRAIKTALARGVDMRDLRARKVEARDFETFHHVIAMDDGHFTILERLGGVERLSMFLETGGNVPDPYYGTQADFEKVFDMIERGCAALLSRITSGK